MSLEIKRNITTNFSIYCDGNVLRDPASFGGSTLGFFQTTQPSVFEKRGGRLL
jgi:hypothetical protein